MKKYLLALLIFLLFSLTANAQTWQGIIIHNGFYCYYLGSEENPDVFAAREINALGIEWVYVKIKSPIDLGNTSTAWAKIDGIATACSYHNGWIYLQLLNPGYNYITVYQDALMLTGGETVTLNLRNLNISQMRVNDHKAFDLYW